MAEISHEPSMEEILSSIKKIISEDSDKSLSVSRRGRADAIPAQRDDVSDVLELNDRVEPLLAVKRPVAALNVQEVTEVTDAIPLVSEGATSASRDAFASLHSASVKPAAAPAVVAGQSVDDLVREMLRPMLKDWLDANLPGIVEGVVAKEVARISGR